MLNIDRSTSKAQTLESGNMGVLGLLIVGKGEMGFLEVWKCENGILEGRKGRFWGIFELEKVPPLYWPTWLLIYSIVRVRIFCNNEWLKCAVKIIVFGCQIYNNILKSSTKSATKPIYVVKIPLLDRFWGQ